jgi:hypothetical protein
MIDNLLKAAAARFLGLSGAETRMLRSVKGECAICARDGNDSNAANNPQCGERWNENQTIRADVIECMCKNVAIYGRGASDEINVYETIALH